MANRSPTSARQRLLHVEMLVDELVSTQEQISDAQRQIKAMGEGAAAAAAAAAAATAGESAEVVVRRRQKEIRRMIATELLPRLGKALGKLTSYARASPELQNRIAEAIADEGLPWLFRLLEHSDAGIRKAAVALITHLAFRNESVQALLATENGFFHKGRYVFAISERFRAVYRDMATEILSQVPPPQGRSYATSRDRMVLERTDFVHFLRCLVQLYPTTPSPYYWCFPYQAEAGDAPDPAEHLIGFEWSGPAPEADIKAAASDEFRRIAKVMALLKDRAEAVDRAQISRLIPNDGMSRAPPPRPRSSIPLRNSGLPQRDRSTNRSRSMSQASSLNRSGRPRSAPMAASPSGIPISMPANAQPSRVSKQFFQALETTAPLDFKVNAARSMQLTPAASAYRYTSVASKISLGRLASDMEAATRGDRPSRQQRDRQVLSSPAIAASGAGGELRLARRQNRVEAYQSPYSKNKAATPAADVLRGFQTLMAEEQLGLAGGAARRGNGARGGGSPGRAGARSRQDLSFTGPIAISPESKVGRTVALDDADLENYVTFPVKRRVAASGALPLH